MRMQRDQASTSSKQVQHSPCSLATVATRRGLTRQWLPKQRGRRRSGGPMCEDKKCAVHAELPGQAVA